MERCSRSDKRKKKKKDEGRRLVQRESNLNANPALNLNPRRSLLHCAQPVLQRSFLRRSKSQRRSVFHRWVQKVVHHVRTLRRRRNAKRGVVVNLRRRRGNCGGGRSRDRLGERGGRSGR